MDFRYKVNTRSSRSDDGEIFCSGRQFLYSYKIVNRFFGNVNVLVDESEIFVNFGIKRGIRKLPQSYFLVEVGPPNDDCSAFVGRSNTCLCVFLDIWHE